MCDPVTIGGAILTGGGMLANSMGANQVAQAQAGHIAQNAQAQAALDARSKGINDASLARYDNFSGTEADKTAANQAFILANSGIGGRSAATAPIAASPNSGAVVAPSMSTLAAADAAKKSALADAFATQQGGALGKMRAFGDVMGDLTNKQRTDAQLINQIGSFKNGQTALLNAELANDQSAGSTAQGLGSLFGGLGKIGVTAGLSGGSSKLAGLFS